MKETRLAIIFFGDRVNSFMQRLRIELMNHYAIIFFGDRVNSFMNANKFLVNTNMLANKFPAPRGGRAFVG